MAKNNHRLDNRPVLMVGVAGDSASGKATFANGVQQILGKENVSWISLDDYHSLDRLQRRRMGVTPLDPRANKMQLIAEHAGLLKAGKSIVKPVYNHSNGTFGEPEELTPGRVVLMTGLLPYMEESMRDVFDLKIFIDPHEELKWKWKVDRDTAKRGYTAHQLSAEVQARKRDFERFVKPQKAYADFFVRYYPATSVSVPQLKINSLVIIKQGDQGGSAQNLAWFCNEVKGIEVHNDVDPLVLEIADQVEGPGIQMIEEQIINGTALLGKTHEPDIWTLGQEKTGLQMNMLLASWQILTTIPGFDDVALGNKREEPIEAPVEAV